MVIFLTLSSIDSIWNTDNTSLSGEEICLFFMKKKCTFKVIMIPFWFCYHSATEIHLGVPDSNKYLLVICPQNILVCIVSLYACYCCSQWGGSIGYSLASLELNCSYCQVHFHTCILKSEVSGCNLTASSWSVMLPKDCVARHND